MKHAQSPHDALVRHLFTDLERAADELRAVLPPALVDRIDWATLALEPGSFVDASLRGRHTDLLFSMRTREGQDLRVHVLFEHQSEPDRWMALRTTEYTVRIWVDFRKRNPKAKHLPVVIPVVFHHGPHGWSAPRALHDLVDPLLREIPELAALVPGARFLVDDLTKLSDEGIEARSRIVALRVGLWLLRDARRRGRLLESLARWGPVLLELVARPGGLRAFEYQLRYFFQVADDAVHVAFRELVDHTRPESSEALMTIEEMLINRGIERGVAQGRAEGRAEGERRAILRVLERRGLSVTASLRTRLDACADLTDLERLLERAFDISVADDLFGG